MTTYPAATTVRETVDELSRRLARIGAAASSLQNVAADTRPGVPPTDLLSLFDQIGRDLALASHQLDISRERAKLALDASARESA